MTRNHANISPSARSNGAVDDLIAQLIEQAGGSPHAEFLEEMIHSALRLIRNQTSRGDVKILNAALRELIYAFRIFAPYRGTRKVTMFGSARISEDAPEYLQAVAFAREMSSRGWMVITGAGEGIMKAGQDGAGRDQSFGVNIRLPFEQSANEVIQNDVKLITFRYFFTRKLVFVKETDAIALFPGGFGTMDEAFETLTLLQTGKSPLLPLVCVDRNGGRYWHAWDAYIRGTLLSRGLIAAEDLSLYRVTDRLEDATDEILTFYRNYHSSRYVGNRLVLRLQQAPTVEAVARLESEFRDILAEGGFSMSSALPEEVEDSALAGLPRLTFVFNRRSFGRLRQLIDALNRL
ncbi:MAG: hypothetical protein H6Q86_6074 [candidate division NC10 bacterium]|nr:hypothetical protein [candidate division NC10 bacterium]